MSKDSWSRALGIGRRGSLGEPFTSTGAISRASSSVASEDEQKTHANVFGANVFVFVCVGVRIPEVFLQRLLERNVRSRKGKYANKRVF